MVNIWSNLIDNRMSRLNVYCCTYVLFLCVACSFLGSNLRQLGIEPMPSLADIRRVVTEHCILPLGKSFPSISMSSLIGWVGGREGAKGKRGVTHCVTSITISQYFPPII